jgi:hypothetical protein
MTSITFKLTSMSILASMTNLLFSPESSQGAIRVQGAAATGAKDGGGTLAAA